MNTAKAQNHVNTMNSTVVHAPASSPDSSFIPDFLPEDCGYDSSASPYAQDNLTYAEQSDLVILGKLYPSQLKLSNLSFRCLEFLAHINSLCDHPRAKKNNRSICMSNSQIAELSCGKFSLQTVKRYLNKLKKAGMIKVCKNGTKRWITALHNTDKKYIPLVMDCRHGLKPSDELVLSFLLDKAAYYARSGIGFYVDNAQMKSLFSEFAKGFGMTRRSITSSLNNLRELGYFTYEVAPDRHTIIKPISFTNKVAEAYRSLLRIRLSATCREQVRNKAAEQFLRKTGDQWLREQYRQSYRFTFEAKAQNLKSKFHLPNVRNMQGQTVPECWALQMRRLFGQDTVLASNTFDFTAEQKVELVIRTISTSRYSANKFKKAGQPVFRQPFVRKPVKPARTAAPVRSRQPGRTVPSAAGSAGNAGRTSLQPQARNSAVNMQASAPCSKVPEQAAAAASSAPAAGISNVQPVTLQGQAVQSSSFTAQPASAQAVTPMMQTAVAAQTGAAESAGKQPAAEQPKVTESAAASAQAQTAESADYEDALYDEYLSEKDMGYTQDPEEDDEDYLLQDDAQSFSSFAEDQADYGSAASDSNAQADMQPAMMQSAQAQPAAVPASMPEQATPAMEQKPEAVPAVAQAEQKSAEPAAQPAAAVPAQPAGQAAAGGSAQAMPAAVSVVNAGLPCNQQPEVPAIFIEYAKKQAAEDKLSNELPLNEYDQMQIALSAYNRVKEKMQECADNERATHMLVCKAVIDEVPLYTAIKREGLKAGDPQYQDQEVVIDLQGTRCSLRQFLLDLDQMQAEILHCGVEFLVSYKSFEHTVKITLIEELNKRGMYPTMLMVRNIASQLYFRAANSRPVLLQSHSYQKAFATLLGELCAHPAMDLDKAIAFLKL